MSNILVQFVSVPCAILPTIWARCHKERSFVMSKGVVVICQCRKCELGVPFTCGHDKCLPCQIESVGQAFP